MIDRVLAASIRDKMFKGKAAILVGVRQVG